VLLTAGALAQIDDRSWMVVSGIMYAGVIGGDSITFLAGRHLGGRVLTSAWFRRLASPQKQARVEEFFERHGTTGLFIARFLPGLRAPIFFTAGSMKVSFLKCLWLDGFAALISVPLFVWLGHWLWARFHADLAELHRAMERAQSYALWGTLLVVALIVLAILLWRRRRKSA